MDYQNGLLFPGQQYQQNQQFLNSPSPIPHSQPPPSASGLYPDPQTRFSQQVPHNQQQAQFHNGPGGFPGASIASSGALMQTSALAHQQRAAQQQNYALYQQGIPPSVATPTSHFPQPPKTFSPPNRASPNATPTKPHQAQNNESVPNTPMAAKTTVQPGQPTPQSAVRSVPQSPVSSEAQTQEKERVTLLLEINAELLQEITSLQTQGKGGYTGVPPQGSAEAGKPPEMKPASKEYIEILKRLQANLSYLASTAEKAQKPNQPVPPGPAIMVAPPTPPSAAELYTKLQSLFPGWKGQPAKPAQGAGGQQRPGFPTQGSPTQASAPSTTET